MRELWIYSIVPQADMLTKGLPKDQFVKLRQMAGMVFFEQFSGSE